MPVKRARRQSRDNETARREILAGAAHLFMAQGYHATSVREITDHLDISQSSLYYHAKNKPQILVDINEVFMTDLAQSMQEIEGGDEPVLEKLKAVVRELLRSIAEHQDEVTVVLHERRSIPPEAEAQIQALRDTVDQVIDRLLHAAMDDGTVRKTSVPLVRLALTGMTNWAYTWFHQDGTLTADEIADGFIDILLHGIEPASAKRAGGARAESASG